ncbi:uncharacterized protein G2W53_044647 [Senna tora]|uniref:Uncharacterized protein n=1 Tax=Senna tora TaxID=362788 RepID=A0A834SCL6_9FABA|nr:uncharacterized protein G2W53_044647 [Senna tora]
MKSGQREEGWQNTATARLQRSNFGANQSPGHDLNLTPSVSKKGLQTGIQGLCCLSGDGQQMVAFVSCVVEVAEAVAAAADTSSVIFQSLFLGLPAPLVSHVDATPSASCGAHEDPELCKATLSLPEEAPPGCVTAFTEDSHALFLCFAEFISAYMEYGWETLGNGALGGSRKCFPEYTDEPLEFAIEEEYLSRNML